MMDKARSTSALAVKPRAVSRSRVGFAGVVVTALLLLFWRSNMRDWFDDWFDNWFDAQLPAFSSSPEANSADSPWMDWNTIPPSEKLQWIPCNSFFGPNFLCARLTVPMDYRRPLNESASNPKVHIAMLMLPGANHSLESGHFSSSPLLLNPGGPGGAGTQMVLGSGVHLQNIIGTHHDVVGFDPRGIGSTWPQANCFVADDSPGGGEFEKNRALMHRLTWLLGEAKLGLAGTEDGSLGRLNAGSKALSAMCADKGGRDSIFRYVGTPHVARDMLSIVQAWDEWTASLTREKGYAAEEQSRDGGTKGDAEGESKVETALADTRGKLVYWGFSYGTFLGATFASMFPESVGRLVLDGVVDTDLYFENKWVEALQDIDVILEKFHYYCHEAKDLCRLYRANDTVQGVKSRLESVMDRLKTDPLTFTLPQVRLPIVVTYSDIKRVLFTFMYFPIMTFPLMATVLDMIYRGQDLGPLTVAPDLFPLCLSSLPLPYYPEDSPLAIGCSDWRYRFDDSLSGLEELFSNLNAKSSFADVWIGLILHCSGWSIPHVDPPSVDWDTFPTGDRPPVNTSFPVLFVSNTHDPVTPLQQGLIQSQRFGSAGFFEQLSDGHCSLSAASLCSVRKIRAYINDGIVPNPPEIDHVPTKDGRLTGRWETCEADEHPWKPYGPDVGLDRVQAAGWRVEDLEIMQSLKELQRQMRDLGRMIPVAGVLQDFVDMDEDEVFARLNYDIIDD